MHPSTHLPQPLHARQGAEVVGVGLGPGQCARLQLAAAGCRCYYTVLCRSQQRCGISAGLRGKNETQGRDLGLACQGGGTARSVCGQPGPASLACARAPQVGSVHPCLPLPFCTCRNQAWVPRKSGGTAVRRRLTPAACSALSRSVSAFFLRARAPLSVSPRRASARSAASPARPSMAAAPGDGVGVEGWGEGGRTTHLRDTGGVKS